MTHKHLAAHVLKFSTAHSRELVVIQDDAARPAHAYAHRRSVHRSQGVRGTPSFLKASYSTVHW